MSESSQINDKIKYKNSEISRLEEKNDQYNKLKNELKNKILPKFNDVNHNFSSANASLKSALESTVSKKQQVIIRDNIDSLNSIKDKIKGKIIPEIDNKISGIKREISSLKSQIISLKSDYIRAKNRERDNL